MRESVCGELGRLGVATYPVVVDHHRAKLVELERLLVLHVELLRLLVGRRRIFDGQWRLAPLSLIAHDAVTSQGGTAVGSGGIGHAEDIVVELLVRLWDLYQH